MRSLNKDISNVIANVSVTYWHSCVFGANFEPDGNQDGLVEAYEFGQHRGIDVQQLLERWIADAIQ